MIIEAIEALGPDKQSVVAKLEELGIKGRRSQACECPITKYLESKGLRYVGTASDSLCFDAAEGDIALTVNTTSAVKYFIQDFDMGKYPELELGL